MSALDLPAKPTNNKQLFRDSWRRCVNLREKPDFKTVASPLLIVNVRILHIYIFIGEVHSIQLTEVVTRRTLPLPSIETKDDLNGPTNGTMVL